jgi:hypothetical protein
MEKEVDACLRPPPGDRKGPIDERMNGAQRARSSVPLALWIVWSLYATCMELVWNVTDHASWSVVMQSGI